MTEPDAADDALAQLRRLDPEGGPPERPELFHRTGCAETVDRLTGGENIVDLPHRPHIDEQE